MLNFIQKKQSRFFLFLLFSFVLTSLSSPAYAWKLRTHAYIANIVMEDAKDGKVWIPPYGEFEVRPEVVDAINYCPAFFRGGSIGPDGFPDFWTGQSIIHPQTDAWLKLLWNNLPPVSTNQPTSSGQTGAPNKAVGKFNTTKLQAWAFTFGYFSHCASDMWAHDWVNIYAGKAFPALSEVKADPVNSLSVITKHIAIETTLDKRIMLSNSVIDIPNDYVLNTMILNQQAIALGMNPVIAYFAAKYFEKLPHKDEIDYGTLGAKGIKVGSGMTAPKKTYDAFWYDDLEKGFRSTDTQNPGWMEANKRAIKDVMEKNKNMIGSLSEYVGMWSLTCFFDMLGFPSVTTYLGESVASNKADIEWALGKIGLSEDQRSQITSDAVNVLLKITLGMDKVTFDRVWSAEITSQLFDAQTTAEIMEDMGSPPSEDTWKSAWTNQSQFNNLIISINGPLYNSVITSKIALLKPVELQRLVGKKLPGLTGEVVILGVLKGIDFSKQFASGNGLGGNWLGYGMNTVELQNASWKPVFPFIFKPYGPRDTTKQEVWSASLDAQHRWAGIYPVSPRILIKPPILSNITMSQFNSETIEVEFKSSKAISTAALEYQTPAGVTKTTAWESGASLQSGQGMDYTLSLHETTMPTGTYKLKIKVKDVDGVEVQSALADFVLFGSSADWGFTATPAANNTVVLKWNKYPRSGEFKKYVLGKGTQVTSTQPRATATSYDADQMPQRGFQPIEVTSIATITKTIPATHLTNLTLTARSKRGNFLTKPIAPTVLQAPVTTTSTATTTTTTTPTTQSQSTSGSQTTTPAGTKARQRYQ